MSNPPTVPQCGFFITLALEASVYLRPERPGLTRDELTAAAASSRYKASTLNEALEWAVRSGQVVWQGDLLGFSPGFEPKFTNFMFGTFRPEYRKFQVLDAAVAYLQGRATAGQAPPSATRAELLAAGTLQGISPHDMTVAFEILRLGRTIEPRGDGWCIAADKATYPLPSVVAGWGKLLDQPRPEIERVYASVRRVIGTGNLSDTMRSDRGNTTSVRRKLLLVHTREDLGRTVEAQLRHMMLDPVVVGIDCGGAGIPFERLEEACSEVGYAVLLVSADDVGRFKVGRELHDRGAQEAIFCWGYLVGRLTRPNVCALAAPGTELPPDPGGVRSIELDPEGRWQARLAAEMAHVQGPSSRS